MSRFKLIIGLLFLSLALFIYFPVEVYASESVTSLKNDQVAYLVKEIDGYMAFSANDEVDYTVEYYDNEFNIVSKMKIAMELPLFGGFYSTDNYYYVLSGQYNDDKSDTVECIRLTKYDRSWNRLANCSVSECYTIFPFTHRRASFDISGNKLIIRTCHGMYNGHQSNMMLLIDVDTMTLLQMEYNIGYSGYVSHSLQQFVKIDDDHVIGADIGDAFPRALQISCYTGNVSSGVYTGKGFKQIQPISFSGPEGNLAVGAHMGGLECSDSSYLVVGTSKDQSNYDTSTTSNVFVATVKKDSGESNINWLTSKTEGSTSCTNEHIVKISSNKFFVVWQNENYNVQYAFVDGNGDIIGSVYSVTGLIGGCNPILDGGEIIWFAYSNKKLNFFRVDSNTGAFDSLIPLSILNCPVNAIPEYSYTGSSIEPKIVIDCNGTILEENTDYILTYSNNIDAGRATVTISGIGNYRGTRSLSFVINPIDCSVLSIPSDIKYEYTGSNALLSLELKYGDADLVANKDYSISISSDGTELGEQTATITFKGNFSGSRDITFDIIRADIAKQSISVPSSYYNCCNSCEPVVTVRNCNNKLLQNGKDYTVSYYDNTHIGKGKCKISGIGYYDGEVLIDFDIVPRPLSDCAYSYTRYYDYCGEPIDPVFDLCFDQYTLVKGVDYTYSCDNDIDAGSVTCTIFGLGNFSGSLKKNFNIRTVSITGTNVVVDTPVYYDGNPKEPSFKVYYNNHLLVENKDYTACYSNNTNVGKGVISLSGIGNFYGVKSVVFSITKKSLDSCDISRIDSQIYTGSAIYPDVSISFGTDVLTRNIDYTLTYDNRVNVGVSTIRVTGIGVYSGYRDVTFDIVQKSIKGMDLSVQKTSYIYNGKEIKPSVSLYDGSNKIVSGYKVSYEDNINSGIGRIIVTGIDNYKDSISAEFTINSRSITNASIAPIADQAFNGDSITPSVIVTDGDITLGLDVDFEVLYADNTEEGTARVTVTGKGNYNGSITATFKIIDYSNYTGWIYVESGKYYYENGEMAKGFKWIGAKRYYFSKKTGKMLTGWRELGGKKYYFNKTTGAATVNGKKIDGKYYLFSTKGVMQKSGWKDDSKGNTYYLKKSGVAYTKKWSKKSGKWYYFGSNGKMVKGTSLKIGKKTYKFKANGVCKNP